MSHNEDFKDSTGPIQILLIVVAMEVFPLFPMLMGWLTALSQAKLDKAS